MARIATGMLFLTPLMFGCAGEVVGVSPGSGSGGAGAAASGGSGSPSGSGGAVGGASGGTIGGDGGVLPCDVASALRTKCQSCHGTTPLNGAPVSLVTYADTQARGVRDSSRPVWQSMQTRVHSTTMTVMPPRGQPALTSTELASLDSWFAAGAPAGTQACAGGGGMGGTTGATGGAGVMGTGGSPTGTGGMGGAGGMGGSGIGPQFLPCAPNRTMVAHAAGSLTTKYRVPNPTNDSYVCFNFRSPFAPGEQAIAAAPIIDDERVIHHWILYGVNTPVTDGSITTGTLGCAATTLSAIHVSGWAPGGGNSVWPSDVGLVLDYTSFVLQVHYNNQRYADAADASGIAFCTTTTPRQNAAGIVPLGNSTFTIPANANDYAVNSNCTNLALDGSTPITVTSTSPHMHLLGTGLRTQHMRGGTNMGDLTNIPLGTWNFDSQLHYPIARRQVLPGDTLRTTCYFDNPNPTSVGFGTKTTDEMCFDFITVYPYAAANKHCSSVF